jgi:hypothetical protein
MLLRCDTTLTETFGYRIVNAIWRFFEQVNRLFEGRK